MNGVTLGGFHTYGEWGLLLKKAPEISPPEPQTHYVEIPGLDGTLDLTEALTGAVKYKDREIKLALFSMKKRAEWADLASDMMEKLHGKAVEIIMDDDPGYAYHGRIAFDKFEYGRHTLDIELTATVSPYKVSIDGEVKKL